MKPMYQWIVLAGLIVHSIAFAQGNSAVSNANTGANTAGAVSNNPAPGVSVSSPSTPPVSTTTTEIGAPNPMPGTIAAPVPNTMPAPSASVPSTAMPPTGAPVPNRAVVPTAVPSQGNALPMRPSGAFQGNMNTVPPASSNRMVNPAVNNNQPANVNPSNMVRPNSLDNSINATQGITSTP